MSLAQCPLRSDLGSPGKVAQRPPPPHPPPGSHRATPGAELSANGSLATWEEFSGSHRLFPLPSHRLPLRAAGGGGCQSIIKSNRGWRQRTTRSCNAAEPPNLPDSCTPAMAPSLLARLLHLAAFCHLCSLLAGEWVSTLPGKEGRGVLGCRLHFPGELGPRWPRPSQWLLGQEWGRQLGGSVGGTRCVARSEGWENLSRLLAGGLC